MEQQEITTHLAELEAQLEHGVVVRAISVLRLELRPLRVGETRVVQVVHHALRQDTAQHVVRVGVVGEPEAEEVAPDKAAIGVGGEEPLVQVAQRDAARERGVLHARHGALVEARDDRPHEECDRFGDGGVNKYVRGSESNCEQDSRKM